MSELKVPDFVDFTIDSQTLRIEAVPYGNIKKITRLAFSVSKDIASGKLKSIPEVIDNNLYEILPLLFLNGRYPFMTPGWIEEHMTVPMIRKMIETAIVVNGLQDFFGQAMGKPKGNGSQPTLRTPPENDGSITSSVSPTAGVPKTLTN